MKHDSTQTVKLTSKVPYLCFDNKLFQVCHIGHRFVTQFNVAKGKKEKFSQSHKIPSHYFMQLCSVTENVQKL
jgi:hypothetical protein